MLSFVNKINSYITFILFNPLAYVVFALFRILVVLYYFLLLISIMSVWNKIIEAILVEENKLKLKEAWLDMKDWLLHK